jgi:hypothetical protein
LQELYGCVSILGDVKTLASSKHQGENTMKRLLATMVLVYSISISALAGEIPIGGYAPPSPDETQSLTGSVTGNELPQGSSETNSTNITLTVLQTVLSLISA